VRRCCGTVDEKKPKRARARARVIPRLISARRVFEIKTRINSNAVIGRRDGIRIKMISRVKVGAETMLEQAAEVETAIGSIKRSS